MTSEKPLAFVIMPFGEEFDTTWSRLIKPPLERAGFRVERGDSVLGSANVLADIVRQITSSTLLVAELTEHNPNVFYELGLAHGLGVPTLLLTRSTTSLPFDLRGYRVFEYSIQFDQADRLTEALVDIGTKHLNKEVSWSDPVKDYAPNARPAIEAAPVPPAELLEQMRQGAAVTLRQFVNAFGEYYERNRATIVLVDETAVEINRLEEAASSTTDAQAQARVGQLVGPLEGYLEETNRVVEKLSGADERVRDAGENLTVVVRAPYSDEQREALLTTFMGLKGIASGAAGWVDALLGLNTALAKFQELEPEIAPLVGRILAAHETAISISNSVQAVLSRTAIVFNEALSPTEIEIQALEKAKAEAEDDSD